MISLTHKHQYNIDQVFCQRLFSCAEIPRCAAPIGWLRFSETLGSGVNIHYVEIANQECYGNVLTPSFNLALERQCCLVHCFRTLFTSTSTKLY